MSSNNNFMPDLLHSALKDNTTYLDENVIDKDDFLKMYQSGNTLLLWSVANSSVNFALKLLDKPFAEEFINTKATFYENTPLILSISKGWSHVPTQTQNSQSQSFIAKKLLEKGADVNESDKHGRTALHYACLHRNIEAINSLVKKGGDLKSLDNNGIKAIDYCYFDENKASRILSLATGGPRNYTFSLNSVFFQNNNIFLQDLAKSLDNPEFSLNHLQSENKIYQELNLKVEDALEPLITHASNLYSKCPSDNLFENFESCQKQFISNNKSLHVGLASFKTSSDITIKLEAILKLISNIRAAAMSNKVQEVEGLINNAVDDPVLTSERDLITRVCMKIINFLSLLPFFGLPIVINKLFTGQTFFSHKTTTEKLIHNLKDNLDDLQDQSLLLI